MENGLAGPVLEMPALSETPGPSGNSENGTGTSTSELLCNINHPEDVGAVVTSFCKLSADGQIKEEVFEDGLFVQPPRKFNEFPQGISASEVLTRPDLDQVDQEEADLDDEMELDDEDEEKLENGQNEIKEEIDNDNNETVENGQNGNNEEPAAALVQAKPKDIIVSIKDENSQSSSEEEYEDEYNAQGKNKIF